MPSRAFSAPRRSSPPRRHVRHTRWNHNTTGANFPIRYEFRPRRKLGSYSWRANPDTTWMMLLRTVQEHIRRKAVHSLVTLLTFLLSLPSRRRNAIFAPPSSPLTRWAEVRSGGCSSVVRQNTLRVLGRSTCSQLKRIRKRPPCTGARLTYARDSLGGCGRSRKEYTVCMLMFCCGGF